MAIDRNGKTVVVLDQKENDDVHQKWRSTIYLAISKVKVEKEDGDQLYI